MGQLESIGSCAVAADMLESKYISSIFLDKIHRQAQKSAIITESIRVRQGKQLTSDGWTGEETRGELQDMILNCYRPMRKEDVDGETYHFITEEQFNDMIEKDLFAEHASYNGWQYGTAKEDCTDDKVVVLTPHGLRQLKKNKDLHIISFYIDVPRRDRLIKILERGDDIEESYRRNLSDVGQFDGIKDEVDYVIPNKGYSWSPLNMAHIIKRSMEWMKC